MNRGFCGRFDTIRIDSDRKVGFPAKAFRLFIAAYLPIVDMICHNSANRQ